MLSWGILDLSSPRSGSNDKAGDLGSGGGELLYKKDRVLVVPFKGYGLKKQKKVYSESFCATFLGTEL